MLDVAVYDPDGVLVASDYNIADSTFTNQQPFQVTTQKPGLYRFVVAQNTNTTFAAAGSGTALVGTFAYTLNISNIGNVSFGGLLAGNIIDDLSNTGTGFSDNSGDIGALLAVGGVFESKDATTIAVLSGNLREEQGAAIGVLTGNVFGQGSSLSVGGSVGLLEGATGILYVTTNTPVGGNIQIISAISNLAFLTVQVDGGIGVIGRGEHGHRSRQHDFRECRQYSQC